MIPRWQSVRSAFLPPLLPALSLCLVVEIRVLCMAATTCYSLCLCLFFVSFRVYILYSAYFVILTMDPKVKDKTGEKKKPKKMISVEAKHEIIAKHHRLGK
ncbi:hypothetical protein NPIL_622541 [Nephila pilipes]|uniref:Uncharacterized protein n=1 Tax=Nephila pilipes TaxID=299642 RepID=A0A8X6TDP4_NEPPI|nr:hypothetical protein NPIL_622541 [Nephila pilipes]